MPARCGRCGGQRWPPRDRRERGIRSGPHPASRPAHRPGRGPDPEPQKRRGRPEPRGDRRDPFVLRRGRQSNPGRLPPGAGRRPRAGRRIVRGGLPQRQAPGNHPGLGRAGSDSLGGVLPGEQGESGVPRGPGRGVPLLRHGQDPRAFSLWARVAVHGIFVRQPGRRRPARRGGRQAGKGFAGRHEHRRHHHRWHTTVVLETRNGGRPAVRPADRIHRLPALPRTEGLFQGRTVSRRNEAGRLRAGRTILFLLRHRVEGLGGRGIVVTLVGFRDPGRCQQPGHPPERKRALSNREDAIGAGKAFLPPRDREPRQQQQQQQ
mmetsp:Transcript_22447/g.47438  ORF Transcript_22447/g.47438 Transcript_22447/m.47438 type:complete len:320 (-) Transcript_22447:2088-3047(-)